MRSYRTDYDPDEPEDEVQPTTDELLRVLVIPQHRYVEIVDDMVVIWDKACSSSFVERIHDGNINAALAECCRKLGIGVKGGVR